MTDCRAIPSCPPPITPPPSTPSGHRHRSRTIFYSHSPFVHVDADHLSVVPQGTIYITRIGGDGSARHSIYRDGIEHATSKAAPERLPLQQTQAREPPMPTPPRESHRPRHAATAPAESQPQPSSRHAPSASQPINLADAPPQHRRSASRAETRPSYNTYRVASPAPMENPGNVNGNPKYPYTQAQAAPPPHRRVASPSPDRGSRREKEKEKDLRRNHTLPATTTSAPMPRPQSPHFYRPRTTSEHKRQLERAQSQAQQQPPSRREPQAAPTQRVPDEGPAYVFSDNEGGRSRPAAYRPSRSNQTYPREAPYPPGPAMAPQVPPKDQEVPRSATQQEFPSHRRQEIPRSSTVRPYHEDPRSARNSGEPKPIIVAPPSVMTNELGLGGLNLPSQPTPTPTRERERSSRHDDRENIHQNQPFGSRSRNESFEEILFAGQPPSQERIPRPQGHGGYSHSQQPVYANPAMMYGNPIPHPPDMRDPCESLD